MKTDSTNTNSIEYAQYLIAHQKSRVSQLLQLPYQMHLRCLRLGKTLDVGCGAGRNLQALPKGSLGVDHNAILIKSCLERGLRALTTEAFVKLNLEEGGERFDSLLVSHVAEHMSLSEWVKMLKDFSKWVKPGGKIVVICPQERGYSSDPSHIEFMDFAKIHQSFLECGITPKRAYSFPLPRVFGPYFRHNEFICIGEI